MFSPRSELVVFMYLNNLLSYSWLVDPRINASDKDLPVLNSFLFSVEIVTKMEEKEVGYQRKIADLEVHLLELGKLRSFFNRNSSVLITN